MNDELIEVLTAQDLVRYTGNLRRSALEVLIASGEFPAPVMVSERRKGWIKDEIIAWQQSRIAASRTGRKRAPDASVRERLPKS